MAFQNGRLEGGSGGLVSALLLAMALMACGGGGTGTGTGSTTGTGGAGTTGTGGAGTTGTGGASTTGTGGASTTGTGGASTTGTGGGSACPADTLCLDVTLLQGSTVPGRLGVAWFQLDDDGPDPVPLVAYDAAFDPQVGHLEIPLSAITIPNEENLLCNRACTDEAMCPCLGDPKVGIGLAFVNADSNANGKIDVDELFGDAAYGIAILGMGYSAVEKASLPAPYDGPFPEGVGAGVLPYRILPKANQGVFDALGRSKAGDVFELKVCKSPGAQCVLPFPNLT